VGARRGRRRSRLEVEDVDFARCVRCTEARGRRNTWVGSDTHAGLFNTDMMNAGFAKS
jgi:hypothetical protein